MLKNKIFFILFAKYNQIVYKFLRDNDYITFNIRNLFCRLYALNLEAICAINCDWIMVTWVRCVCTSWYGVDSERRTNQNEEFNLAKRTDHFHWIILPASRKCSIPREVPLWYFYIHACTL